MINNICIVTGSRAEYDLLYWLLTYIDDDPDLNSLWTTNLGTDGFQLQKGDIVYLDNASLGKVDASTLNSYYTKHTHRYYIYEFLYTNTNRY